MFCSAIYHLIIEGKREIPPPSSPIVRFQMWIPTCNLTKRPEATTGVEA